MRRACEIIFVGLVTLLSGCETMRSNVNEKMLPNGDWAFELISNYTCEDRLNINSSGSGIQIPNISDLFKKTPDPTKANLEKKEALVNRCTEEFKSSLSARAKELCGSRFEIYGCINSENTGDSSLYHNTTYGYYMTCYARCLK